MSKNAFLCSSIAPINFANLLSQFSKNSISKIVETSEGEKTVFYEKFVPEKKDALLEEINNFIESVLNRTSPNVDGKAGKKALDIALQIENKIFLND